MARALILAFDIGTSSFRTALFDPHGRRVPETLAQQTYPLLTNPEGQAELDPAALEKAARACLARTLAAFRQRNKKERITATGASCFWHSLLAADSAGVPLSPIYTWAESRCKTEAEKLRQKIDERAYHQSSGAMLRASFWPAKLAWLKKTRPALFSQAAAWLSPADWLFSRFCTGWHPSYSMASGTGLFNRKSNDWDDSLLRRFGISRSQLGVISDAPLATAPEFSQTFPELGETQWLPPIGDGAASNLGCGATAPGQAAINFGTSAAIRVISTDERPKVPFGLFAYRVDARRWLIGGAISNAGNLRAWALQNLQLPDDEALEKAFQNHVPASLTALPFLAAERAPSWPEEVPAALLGFNLSTTAVDIFAALTE
ncbi:MAG TPA: FGGY family carbohydrate kinase, partial [Chthoniobacterales bacterium]